MALRAASSAMSGGKSAALGMPAPSTKAGMTSLSRASFADLGLDEVARMVESALAVGVSGGEPVLPDDRDQRVAARDSIGDNFREVRAGDKCVQISEYVLASGLNA